MKCPQCGFENRMPAKFCPECAHPELLAPSPNRDLCHGWIGKGGG